MHALCPALSPGVRVLLWCVWQLVAALVQWLQQAAGSGRSTHTRTACRNKQKVESEEQKSSDPLAQIGENASQLMAALPTHSHHRAPLLHALSHHIPSSTAATLLHAAPSTVRNAKRKDYSDADLVQQRYASGVKRRRATSLQDTL